MIDEIKISKKLLEDIVDLGERLVKIK